MENFEIKSLDKKVMVNNIELNLIFDDNEFIKKLKKLSDEISDLTKSGDDSIEKTNKLSKTIDDIFGENTCLNIFGTSNPTSFLLGELIEYIFKFLDEAMSERKEKISEKYNPERDGSSE